ncbi:MAG: TIGR03986 family CRISPR-associated RAMP protein [Chloroflexi bacterium]|nr:TIGR03986 family CRISPR-associated RAMP protein [Chloroflexota bacterium]
MAKIEGTVQTLSHHSGKIRGDDGKLYKFNRKAIDDNRFDEIKRGQRVRFRPDDERAREVELLDEVVPIKHKPRRHSPPQPKGPYRFLNPYNFVRTLEPKSPNAAPLLGRVPPPPHDRYVGLSGRITCKLTATTPLFVSDSEGVTVERVEGKEHKHYRFFRDPDGNIAIPGTSLRGPVRSVFEAVTNSCFAHFEGDKRLSYHLAADQASRLIPGRVRKNGDVWELELLPGTTPATPERRPSGPQYAAWVPLYRPLWASRTYRQKPNTPYARRSKLPRSKLEHGNPYWAIIERIKHPMRHFEFWNVTALADDKTDLPRPTQGQRIVQGYLCINNQNIENKHDERLFFRAPNNSSINTPLKLTDDVLKHYEELIADYQERHEDDVRKRKNPEVPAGKKPAFSRFIVHKDAKKLKEDDLVYAMLERAQGGWQVKFLVPVSVPRVGYERTIGELLTPGTLKACQDVDKLCPACRTFGWVHAQAEKVPLDASAAYASRVRFSLARRITSPGEPFDVTLAILGSPKPTTTRFYLRPQNGKPEKGLDDDKVSYDAHGQVLRGRKFYRHHGQKLSRQEYERAGGGKSDQNRTVHDVQPAGTVFEFTVEFENLAQVELGALLWSLEMEGWHHRLGYAKPLGFGSAVIQIESLQVLAPDARYASLQANAGWQDALAQKEAWVKAFKEAMRERYGAAFEDLPNVRDMRTLLAETAPLPVHYPRSSQKPNPEGKNFEWFVGNKRSGRNAGPRLVLPLAEDDTKGFPLITKDGSRVEG